MTRTPTVTPTRTASRTPTRTPSEFGPIITYFGAVGANGCAACNHPQCICSFTPTPTPFFDNQGRQVFEVGSRGFLLVVEAKPGANGRAVGKNVPDPIPGQTDRPDLQILANRSLGDGSAAICDKQPISEGGGGIPGFDPPSFLLTQSITDALIDFACRFSASPSGNPCTLNANGNYEVLTPGGITSSGKQFCYLMEQNTTVPTGDTVLAVQVRDTAGNVGPVRELVLRRTTQ